MSRIARGTPSHPRHAAIHDIAADIAGALVSMEIAQLQVDMAGDRILDAMAGDPVARRYLDGRDLMGLHTLPDMD